MGSITMLVYELPLSVAGVSKAKRYELNVMCQEQLACETDIHVQSLPQASPEKIHNGQG